MQPKIKVRFSYRQGVRRILAILAVLWLILVGYGRWVKHGDDYSDFLVSFFQIGILPVVVVYILGMLCVWMIEGFAQADR